MAAGDLEHGVFLSGNNDGGARPPVPDSSANKHVTIDLGDMDTAAWPMQADEDSAVAAELDRLVIARLPANGNVSVVLCHDPEAVGVSREALAEAMVVAYSKAGIGERAEGIEHFEKLLRGYQEHHGPVRFVIITDPNRVWVFCDYFAVDDGFKRLGDPYAPAVEQWKQINAHSTPAEYVMSKLLNTQNLTVDPNDSRRARIAAGLGARVFASIVQGVANAHEHGMLLAGNAQLGTRNFVIRRLGSLLTGRLEVVFDRMEQGEDGGAPQAQMVIHVLPAGSDKE